MKTFTLLLLQIAITSTLFSQTKKGQFLIGGAINFESVNEDYSINETHKSSNFFVSPSVGYFIINNLATGLRMSFDSYDSKSNNLETKFSSTSILPFVRYYVLPIRKKVNAFVDVSYIHKKTRWSSFNNSPYYEKSKGYQVSAGPSIFLTDQVALEFTLGFKHTKSDGVQPKNSNTVSSGFGLQIHLGKNKNKTS